ncbi:MAG: aspartate--tRNA(Asn) ligase [Candidatus Thermoplasmatota archaeon]
MSPDVNPALRLRSIELSPEMDGREVVIAGWVQDVRNLGGISFIQLRDRGGVVQVTAPRKKVPIEIFKALSALPRESVIAIKGVLRANKEARAGFEVIPSAMDVLSIADAPLPMGVIDKVGVDLDTRLNNRFMDLRREHVAAIFRIRDCLLSSCREFLSEEGFVEIHTPKIVGAGAEGGATLFPISYFGREAYLAQSPQLYKQSLMASGFERVYEIAPAYRAEKSDTVRHLAEFLSLDMEMAFIKGPEDIMKMTERLTDHAMRGVEGRCARELALLNVTLPEQRPPFPRLSYDECISMLRAAGRDVPPGVEIDTENEKLLAELLRTEYGARHFFITDFPTELKHGTFYAMRRDEDPRLTCYFDLEFDGEELVSGGQREHRYDVLVRQIQEAGLDPSAFEFYLNAFRYGMPPHGGIGMGIERFLHVLLRLPNIRECVLFPRDRTRLVP